MKKWLKMLMISSCGVVLITGGTALIAAEEESGPEKIIIDNEGYKSNRKGAVKFSHQDHAEDYDVACDECHHEYKEGKNIWSEGDPVKKCSACHNPLKNQGEVKKLQLAFHKNCKICHKELAKNGVSEDAPYKKCSDCHEKKS